MDFIKADLEKDPVIGVNFATGEIMRRSGNVLGSLPTRPAPVSVAFQPPAMGPIQSYPTAFPHATTVITGK